MKSSGVEIVDELLSTDRFTSLMCADPDGYHLQVYWDPAEMPAPATV
jgi:hypothetical protein